MEIGLGLYGNKKMHNLETFFKNKKVLVTGHTGFKGAWLTRILLDWGAEVCGVSLPPHTNPNLFTVLGLEKKIQNHFVDVRDYTALKSVVASFRPEIIFHLAAQALVRESYDDPLFTFSTNVMGTVNILHAAKEVGSARSVILVTTDKVYENKEDMKVDREDDLL